MSTTKKNPTSKSRVAINTLLLLALSAICAIASVCACGYLKHELNNTGAISNSPALCNEVEGEEYICSLEVDENNKNIAISDNQDFALFNYDQFVYTRAVQVANTLAIAKMIGVISVSASLLGAIVYWNHNR